MKELLLDNSYRLLEELGKGGFGAVFKAVRIGSEGAGPIAIKVLHRNPDLKFAEYVRFQREATLMSQLVHPNIVAVYELGEHQGSYFIAMEYVKGKNLREYVTHRGGDLQLNEIIEILIQAAEGLEYVHGHQVIHRDIKPQNLLIKETLHNSSKSIIVKIVDFGVARLGYSVLSPHEAPSERNEVVGTYAFMPPESTGLVDWFPDQRSDIYSLGVVAFDLIAGKPPFFDLKGEELRKAHVYKAHPTMSQVRNLAVAPILEKIVAKCLQKNPKDRYQSMFALICDLKRVLENVKKRENLEDFTIANKDHGFGQTLRKIYVGHSHILNQLTSLNSKETNRKSRLNWTVIKGPVGSGKTRCLEELRRQLENLDSRYLYLRFSESEQRLPFQSLTLAINDYLSYFERFNSAGYRYFIDAASRDLGDGAPELARLIPALRPILKNVVLSEGVAGKSTRKFQTEKSFTEEPKAINFSNVTDFDRRYAAPNSRINQSFVALFNSLVGLDSHLIFLMDDIHLADSSTLALFQFMTEQVNGIVNYGFVFTMRNRLPKSNFVLENFVRRLTFLKRRFHSFELTPFTRENVHSFCTELGFIKPSQKLVEFLLNKCDGYPLQLHSVIKQLLSKDIIEIEPQVVEAENKEKPPYLVNVKEDLLDGVNIDITNIELLIASLDSLGSRDIKLLEIAAVCQGATEYSLFKIYQDYSRVELDSRLQGFISLGIFEVLQTQDFPINQQDFIFTHEKIKNAVWNSIELESRKELHWALAKNIEDSHKNLKREQILGLAKHCDGAGDLADSRLSIQAFVKAAKIYIEVGDTNLAQYFLNRSQLKLKQISNDQNRLLALQNILEVHYFLKAAQGNMIEAVEACNSLISLVTDTKYKLTIIIFLAQIYLGMGRHFASNELCNEVLSQILDGKKGLAPWIKFLHSKLYFKPYYRFVSNFISNFFPFPKSRYTEEAKQSVVLSLLLAMHGSEQNPKGFLMYGYQLGMMTLQNDKWASLFRAMYSFLEFRNGKRQPALALLKRSLHECEVQGHVDASRWIRLLKAIWMDYPANHCESVFKLLDTSKTHLFPTSGVLFFEGIGLKSWICLIAPRSPPALDLLISEKKILKRAGKSGSNAVSSLAELLHSEDSSNLKKIFNSGENNHFISLALFCESLKFAFSDRTESLKLTLDQVIRQQSKSFIGQCFASLSLAARDLFIGSHNSSLKHYFEAKKKLQSGQITLLNAVCCDGIRLAFMILPVLAASFKASGWAWGSGLTLTMAEIQNFLTKVEDNGTSRESIMALFFNQFCLYVKGERTHSLKTMNQIILSAHAQKLEFLECLFKTILATFLSMQEKRKLSHEHFIGALKLAREFEWLGLERQILSISKRTPTQIADSLGFLEETSKLATPNQKHNSAGLDHSIFPYLQALTELKDFPSLFGKTLNLTQLMFNPKESHIFLRPDSNPKSPYSLMFSSPQNSVKEKRPANALLHPSPEAVQDVNVFTKWMSSSITEAVKVIPMSEVFHYTSAFSDADNKERRKLTPKTAPGSQLVRSSSPVNSTSSDGTVAFETPTESDSATVNLASPWNGPQATEVNAIHPDGDQTQGLMTPEETPKRRSHDQEYVVLCAIAHKEELLGWIVLSNVSSRVYSSIDMEQDLILLGLHLGHLVRKLRLGRENTSSKYVLPSIYINQSKQLPYGIKVEEIGSQAQESLQKGSRVLSVTAKILLASSWSFELCADNSAADDTQALHFVPKLLRHLEFFSASASQSLSDRKFETLCQTFRSDIIWLVQNTIHSDIVSKFDFSVVLFSPSENSSFELVFGNEIFGFNGSNSIQDERIEDLGALVAQGRLVCREKLRNIRGLCGWMFSQNKETLKLLPKFSEADFLEKYIEGAQLSGFPITKHFDVSHESKLAGFLILYEPFSEVGDLAKRGA